MNIAIIGTGIAGLSAAHALAPEHRLTLFEAGSHVGGHTVTTPIESDGTTYRVDAGFVVFNRVNYPLFSALLESLGVASRPTGMSFGVSCERTGLEYSGRSLNALFAQRKNLLSPRFWRLLADVARFNRDARRRLAFGGIQPTMDEMIRGGGYSRGFVDHYLVPMTAAIWSTDPDRMARFPAPLLLRFLDNHNLLTATGQHQWRTIVGGSSAYVERLIEPFRDRIRLRTPVRAVRRATGGVEVVTDGRAQRYDRAVLATHSDQALALLDPPSDAEREVLGAIRYQANDASLHTDTTLMPRNRRAWAAWNYRLPAGPVDRVRVTYDMCELQGLDADPPFLVSLNQQERIDPAKVLRRFSFDHPVFTPEAVAAQRRHGEIDGRDRVHFCGAYWRNGFHEDGVASGLEVARRLGSRLRVAA